MIDTDFVQRSPVLAGPIPARAPLPFFQYIRTVRDNAIAGFHDDVFKQRIVETRLWKLHTFIVNDPLGIKHVLVDNAANYVKGDIEQRILRTWPDKGFAGGDDKEWRLRRRTMSPSFDHRSVLENSSAVLDAAQRLLARWNALPRGTIIEASADMTRMALEVITHVVFSSDSIDFVRIMERASGRYQRERIFDLPDFVPMLDWLWGFYKHLKRRRIFKELDESIDHLIAKRVGGGSHSVSDFLGHLIGGPQTGGNFSAQEVHSQVVTILGAGHEAVASTLTWVWYLLSQHPQEEARLHSELDGVLAGRTPALEDLAKLPYTRMVIAEALRLYPPVHTMAWRGALGDDEICGMSIPKGATVSIIPWVLHRHSKMWDHPERFDPERFSPDRSLGRSRFAYLPFGIGPRVCVGASFAVTEIMLILATLAQRYRLRLAWGHKVEPQGLILLKARYGLKATLESRHQASTKPDCSQESSKEYER
jgi:cytochrome P450